MLLLVLARAQRPVGNVSGRGGSVSAPLVASLP